MRSISSVLKAGIFFAVFAIATTAQTVRTQQDINRDRGADVKDFGAKCDGVTDDTDSIQAALNSASPNGRLTISGPGPCVVSHTVYIPGAAEGMILESTRLATEIGLIAKQGAPPFQMLRIYAGQVHVRDLNLNCNSTASTGLVIVAARQSVFDNVYSIRCTSDAILIDPFATPTTTLTSSLSAGSVSGANIGVAKLSLDGTVLGGRGCNVILLDYGKPSQEAFLVAGSGNTLRQSSPTKSLRPHDRGATVQCYGNNNGIILNNPEGLYSVGWGLDMFGGTDNNAVTIRDPTMFGNKAGGEILSGSVGRHIGGHLEGNAGPAIQLGDLNGGAQNGANGRVTFGWTIDPVNDLENAPPHNGVFAVCDGYSHVTFKSPSELIFNGPSGPFCPSLPAGVSTLGTGYDFDSTGPKLTVKAFNGTTSVDPLLGISFHDLSGKTEDVLGPINANILGALNFSSNMRLQGNQLNLQNESSLSGIELNYAGKRDTPVTLYNGAGTPEVVLNPTGNSSFIGVHVKNLAGSGNRPACIDAAGNIYAGTNIKEVLSCP